MINIAKTLTIEKKERTVFDVLDVVLVKDTMRHCQRQVHERSYDGALWVLQKLHV